MEGEAHKDISQMTLRPMSYRAQGVEGAQPIMFDDANGRTLFLETVIAWMVEHGFNPQMDLATQVAAEFMTGITWEPIDDQHIVWACKSIATTILESGDITNQGTISAEACHRCSIRQSGLLRA